MVLMLAARGAMADGQWQAMVDVVGRWMGVKWKMDADDRGRTGYPAEFSTPKSNKFDIFLDVARNC